MNSRHGGISVAIVLLVFFIILAIGAVLAIVSIKVVVQTTADVERISQGDTVLFAMLETGYCAAASGAPLKYVLGAGLASGAPNPVSVNYAGATENVNIKDTNGCVSRFMQSVKVGNYNFSAAYGAKQYNVVSGYKAEDRKRIERVYVAVPDGTMGGVAEVVLSTNLPERGEKPCPEKDGSYFCTPETYCTLAGSSCSKDSDGKNYLCGGATCCCQAK